MVEMGWPVSFGPVVGRCPVCTGRVRELQRFVCRNCNGLLHASCRDWIGGCSTFGCAEAGTFDRRQAEYLFQCISYRVGMRKYEFFVACVVIFSAAARGRMLVSVVWLIIGGLTATRYASACKALARIDQTTWSIPSGPSTVAGWFIDARRVSHHRGLLRALCGHFIGFPIYLIDIIFVPILVISSQADQTEMVVLSLLWIIYRGSPIRYVPSNDRLEALAAGWIGESRELNMDKGATSARLPEKA